MRTIQPLDRSARPELTVGSWAGGARADVTCSYELNISRVLKNNNVQTLKTNISPGKNRSDRRRVAECAAPAAAGRRTRSILCQETERASPGAGRRAGAPRSLQLIRLFAEWYTAEEHLPGAGRRARRRARPEPPPVHISPTSPPPVRGREPARAAETEHLQTTENVRNSNSRVNHQSPIGSRQDNIARDQNVLPSTCCALRLLRIIRSPRPRRYQGGSDARRPSAAAIHDARSMNRGASETETGRDRRRLFLSSVLQDITLKL
ncbi:hypothetical protein EVAR_86232_1 [Eumeta japonica]|uniref:Uncharacterized protein n=1 Tax=Eumeta variegata TaxID=151549 RepID=A0A4C1UBM3_EUMVA|nr:hypothetical protein EVAR_86232_1 [Eumeta japonica]